MDQPRKSIALKPTIETWPFKRKTEYRVFRSILNFERVNVREGYSKESE